jgi:hypothetical protein
LDTQGYGFSDKPRNGYKYSVEDDARLVNYHINEVLNVRKLTVVTHDKGNSVGLALLDLYKNQDRYTIGHLILTNGTYRWPTLPVSKKSSQTASLVPWQPSLLLEKHWLTG